MQTMKGVMRYLYSLKRFGTAFLSSLRESQKNGMTKEDTGDLFQMPSEGFVAEDNGTDGNGLVYGAQHNHPSSPDSCRESCAHQAGEAIHHGHDTDGHHDSCHSSGQFSADSTHVSSSFE